MELHEVKHDNRFIKDWNFKESGDFRLYYSLCPENGGFQFCAVQWTGSYWNMPKWSDSTLVDIAIHGWAAFDGVRHLYFGHEETDNEGYFNYPDLQELLDLLRELNGLQTIYCSDYGGSQ